MEKKQMGIECQSCLYGCEWQKNIKTTGGQATLLASQRCGAFDQIAREKTDNELVSMVKQNSEFYSLLMERYEGKIKSYIKRIGKVSQETAEDIAQDVFMKAYISLDKFNPEYKFSSWVYRIAHNETVNYCKRTYGLKVKHVFYEDNEALKNYLQNENDLGADVYQKITDEKVAVTLNNLGEKYRQALVLNYLEGKNYKEISRELNKPVNTVGTILSRAKKMMRAELMAVGLTPELATRW